MGIRKVTNIFPFGFSGLFYNALLNCVQGM